MLYHTPLATTYKKCTALTCTKISIRGFHLSSKLNFSSSRHQREFDEAISTQSLLLSDSESSTSLFATLLRPESPVMCLLRQKLFQDRNTCVCCHVSFSPSSKIEFKLMAAYLCGVALGTRIPLVLAGLEDYT